MAGVELLADARSGRPFPVARRAGYRVCLACRPRGLLIRPLGDVVVLMPPLTATVAELRWMVATVRAAIDEVLGA